MGTCYGKLVKNLPLSQIDTEYNPMMSISCFRTYKPLSRGKQRTSSDLK